MSDLTKLTAEELLEHLIAQKQFAWQSPLLGEILRMLKRLEKCEAAILVADMYILKLRQAWYGNPDKPSVRENAVAQLNACGSAWTAARAALEGQ